MIRKRRLAITKLFREHSETRTRFQQVAIAGKTVDETNGTV